MDNRKMKLLLLLFSLSAFSQEIPLREFATDYCTMYPEGTKDDPEAWKHCCVAHDLYMWAGGEKEDRLKVDLDLKKCVLEAGYEDHANRIYLGVRLGSVSPIKLKEKAWGNAWSKRPAYSKLTEEETQRLLHALKDSTVVDPSLYQNFQDDLLLRLE